MVYIRQSKNSQYSFSHNHGSGKWLCLKGNQKVDYKMIISQSESIKSCAEFWKNVSTVTWKELESN